MKFLRKAWYTHVLFLSGCNTKGIRMLCSSAANNPSWVHLSLFSSNTVDKWCMRGYQEGSRYSACHVAIAQYLPSTIIWKSICTHLTNYIWHWKHLQFLMANSILNRGCIFWLHDKLQPQAYFSCRPPPSCSPGRCCAWGQTRPSK